MKPLLQRLPLSKGISFIFERYESPFFETPWHYHEELEIVLCDGGFGKKVVGNHTSEYQENDLMLLGSNLPHWFRADDSYYNSEENLKPASIVIQFRIDSFGEYFFQMSEMKQIFQLFEKAKYGIAFSGKTKERINEILRKNIKKSGIEKLLSLFEILKLMAFSDESKTLSAIGMAGVSLKDSERMNVIFDQILKHFKEEISIEKLAQMTNFSKAAFCRYFKSRTQKTFIEYLSEVRINHACKLLKESEMSILEICYESGFNNLSNFNRQFRKQMNTNPKEFRKT